MPTLRIITEGSTLEFENGDVQTVGDLLRETAGVLNISPSASIAVNGVPATADTALNEGDEVTTTKAAGTKGL